MNSTPSREHLCIEWDVASRAFPGEVHSGDLHAVAMFPGGALAAVVDGLGHGCEAAIAAKVAVAVLRAHAGEPLPRLVERCHAALKATRGAVMTLMSFDFTDGTAAAIGIGNVETLLVRANRAASPPCELVLLRGGIVGGHLPTLQASSHRLQPGDLLVFATDGIREGYGEQVRVADSPRQVAGRVLEHGFRGNDDALVLAVRYLGPQEQAGAS